MKRHGGDSGAVPAQGPRQAGRRWIPEAASPVFAGARQTLIVRAEPHAGDGLAVGRPMVQFLAVADGPDAHGPVLISGREPGAGGVDGYGLHFLAGVTP